MFKLHQVSVASFLIYVALMAVGSGCSGDNPAVPTVPRVINQVDASVKMADKSVVINPIKNPGFENGFNYWEPCGPWSVSSANPHGGTWCASCVAPSGSGYLMAELYTAPGGCIYLDGSSTRYRFSFWARMERPDGTQGGPVPSTAGAILYFGGQTFITQGLVLNDSWQQFTQDLTIDYTGCGNMVVHVFGDATLSTLGISLDDFALIPLLARRANSL